MLRISAVAVFFLVCFAFVSSNGGAALILAAEPEADDKSPVEPNLFLPSNNNSAYLSDLRRLRQELARVEKDRDWRNAFLQFVGTQYSFIGRYQKALDSFDVQLGRSSTSSREAIDYTGYESSDAVATVLELANRHQVIMVNEAHHVPLHRAFTIELLEELYRKGFRYFAAETLTIKDEDLHARGYPTLKTGYYLHEPLYADLVRIAMRLGYQIVPYEFEKPEGKKIGKPALVDDNFFETQNAREEGQARNLKERILDKDPKAKILVHAGYGHICKKPATWEVSGKQGEVRFMAFSFQKLTGIEPLCIDQTIMTERSKPEKDSRDYRAAIEQGLLKDKPVVLRRSDTHDHYTEAEAGYDLVVFHPRTRYPNGRPTWMSLAGRRKAHAVQGDVHPAGGASCLAQAFYANERGPEAVPVDQVEYGADEPLPTLWLPSGKFCIRIIDDSGKSLHEYSMSVSP